MKNHSDNKEYPKYRSYTPDENKAAVDDAGDLDINIGVEDDALVTRIKRRETSWSGHYKELQEIATRNRDYWRGKIDLDKLYEGEDPVNINLIFQSIETIIPIVTAKTPEPNLKVRPLTQKNMELQEKVEAKLKELWEVDWDMSLKMESGIRNLATGRYFAVKYLYDFDEKQISIVPMPIGKLSFPKDYASVNECPAIIEYVDSTVGEMKELFSSAADKIDEHMKSAYGSEYNEDTKQTYVEYWEDEFYACYWENILLHKDLNPNFNWGNDGEPGTNHFKSPKKPYLFLNWFTYGDQMVDDTSIIEQASPVQDSVNKRKRQFDMNADLSNGKLAVAGGALSKENAMKINHSPKEMLYLDGADSVAGAFQYIYGRPVDPSVFNDMQDSKNSMDNIMGTHSTTRGERQAKETATGRSILKDSDVGRLKTLSRRIEKFSEAIFDASVQLMFVFYDEEHPVILSHESKSSTNFTIKESEAFIKKTDFEGIDVRVLVAEGSTTPRDKATEKAEAVDIWKNGGMSTVDLYRKLEYADAEKLALNAFLQEAAPEVLYRGIQGDAFDVDAIRNLFKISKNNQPEMITWDDPERLTNYTETLTQYVNGIEVDPDLTPFKDLDRPSQVLLREHLQEVVEYAMAITEAQEPLVGDAPPGVEAMPPGVEAMPPEMAMQMQQPPMMPPGMAPPQAPLGQPQ